MADDLSLLLNIRGNSAGGKAAVAETRTAIASLRSTTATEFSAMQTASKNAFSAITDHLNVFVGQRIPLVGGAFIRVTENIKGMASEAEGAGGALAGMAGPIGIAVVATLALTAAGAALAAKFFELTKSTADFQGKLFDLSQATGVSVETLSALEILAKTTGGSIEQISASLGIFQKNLEDAQDPTSKQAKLLKELGVESKTTEGALRETLTRLAAMPEGFHQTATALELFGRGGKSILAILKEMGGDLDGAIEKFRKMGILISSEDAKAADEFNDSLAMLDFQIRAVTVTLTKDSIPAFTAFFQLTSEELANSKTGWRSWGEVIQSEVVGAQAVLLGFAHWLESGGYLDLGATISAAAKTIRDRMAFNEVTGGVNDTPSDRRAPRPAGKAKKDPRPHQAFEEDLSEIRAAATEREAAYKEETEAIKREYAHRLLTLEEYIQNERDANERRLGEMRLNLLEQNAAVIAALQLKSITDIEAEKRASEIRQARAKVEREYRERETALDDEFAKSRDKQELDLNKQLLAINEARREGELNNISDALEKQYITESQAIARRQEIYKQAHDDRMLLLDLELNQETVSAERKTAIDNEKIASEQRYTDEKERLTKQRISAEIDEVIASEDRRFGKEGPKTFGALGAPPPPPKLSPWVAFGNGIKSALGSAGNAVKGFAGTLQTLGEMGGNALGGLADALGGMVNAWVLMGSEADISVKKMVAGVLAGVASQSAVLAVFELAQGFAALFWNPAAAAAHFQAAALFGSLAVVTAVAGRGIAGDSFQRGHAASGSGAGRGGGTSGGTSNAEPATADINRRVGSQQPIINVHLHGEFAQDHFETKVGNAVARSWSKGGKVRTVSINDGVLVP